MAGRRGGEALVQGVGKAVGSLSALDRLFLMIAKQEKETRRDPVGQSSKLLQKVFGALKF